MRGNEGRGVSMTKSTMAHEATALKGLFVVCVSSLLAACAGHGSTKISSAERVERVVGPHDPVTPGGGRNQIGKPYTIGGKTYVPKEDPNYDATGTASWYGGDYHHGTRTANGEVVDRHAITAAHPTMPLPSYARVTNLRTGRSIIVRVNDRGPYARNRLIDISEKTAELLDMKKVGTDQVRVQYVGKAGLAGSDQAMLMASLQGAGRPASMDDRTLIARADLAPGPRRTPTAPAASTMVADARMPTDGRITAYGATSGIQTAAVAAPTLGYAGAARPGLPRGLAAVPDAFSMDLAGVDAAALRAAAKERAIHRATTSGEAIAAELPAADGLPLALGPQASVTPSGLPTSRGARSSYAAEDRITAAHAAFGDFGGGDLTTLTR